MDLSSLAGFQLDDSSLGVIALLAGIFGGYWINGHFEQLKAKRAKVPARSQSQRAQPRNRK